MALVAVLGGIIWFAATSDGRHAAEARAVFLSSNCPDLTSADDCRVRVEQAKARQDALDAARLAAEQDAAAQAAAAQRAAARDAQNRDPSVIDAIVASVFAETKTLYSSPACGPQLKGTPGWIEQSHRKAADLSRRVDSEIVATPTARQQKAIGHLRAGLTAAASCGRCTPESEIACKQEQTEWLALRRLGVK